MSTEKVIIPSLELEYFGKSELSTSCRESFVF